MRFLMSKQRRLWVKLAAGVLGAQVPDFWEGNICILGCHFDYSPYKIRLASFLQYT